MKEEPHRNGIAQTLNLDRIATRIAAVAVFAALLAACVTPSPVIVLPAAENMPATGNAGENTDVPLHRLDCANPDFDILASVVRVATTDGSDASGVVIGRDLVLTAAHVVDSEGRALVYIDRQYRFADIIALDRMADLALLAVSTDELKPVRISRTNLADAEPVWAIGYPLALEQKTTTGVVTRQTRERLMTSAPIREGASGGGLLRCEHGSFELAGMIRSYAAVWQGGQLVSIDNLSISVPADAIEQFVGASGTTL